MGQGQGSVTVNQLQPQSGAPFTNGSAINGLSVTPAGRIVLGQDIGAVGDPAILLSNREIPMGNFTFSMINAGVPQLTIDPVTPIYALGDITNAVSNLKIDPNGGIQFSYRDKFGIDILSIGDQAALPRSILISPNYLLDLHLDESSGQAILEVAGGGATISVAITGEVRLGDLTGNLFSATQALTNHVGALLGTLGNSPVAGNPTKWISINDNGTVRRFPTW